MFYFYVFLTILIFLTWLFFVIRTIVTLFSFFTKVPYVPLSKLILKESISFLDLKEGDSFVDIGSGDGRVVFWVGKNYPYVRKSKGLEINSFLVCVSNFLLKFRSSKVDVSFAKVDAVKFNYENFNKVHMYLLPDFIDELMPILEKQLPSKAIVVSSVYSISDVYKRSGSMRVKTIQFRGNIEKIFIWEKF